MNKTETHKRLDAIEKEAAALRKLIEREDGYSKMDTLYFWVSSTGYVAKEVWGTEDFHKYRFAHGNFYLKKENAQTVARINKRYAEVVGVGGQIGILRK